MKNSAKGTSERVKNENNISADIFSNTSVKKIIEERGSF